jgi:hypothetical protein
MGRCPRCTCACMIATSVHGQLAMGHCLQAPALQTSCRSTMAVSQGRFHNSNASRGQAVRLCQPASSCASSSNSDIHALGAKAPVTHVQQPGRQLQRCQAELLWRQLGMIRIFWQTRQRHLRSGTAARRSRATALPCLRHDNGDGNGSCQSCKRQPPTRKPKAWLRKHCTTQLHRSKHPVNYCFQCKPAMRVCLKRLISHVLTMTLAPCLRRSS